MCKHDYISYQHDNNDKYEVCIQANITKKPFSKVKKYYQLLELIHSDICEVNDMLTRGEKKIFHNFYWWLFLFYLCLLVKN